MIWAGAVSDSKHRSDRLVRRRGVLVGVLTIIAIVAAVVASALGLPAAGGAHAGAATTTSTSSTPAPGTGGTGSGVTTQSTTASTSSTPAGSAAPPISTPAGCPSIQYTPYGFGSSYNGLPLTYSATVCNQPPTDAGPAVPFTDVIYGTCQAASDYGCPAPLEIQSWPECHRNYGSYSNGPVDQQMNPSALTTISTLPGLPAAMFDGGTRLELYTGDTTVVVFGDDTSQVMAAGSALSPQLAPHIAAMLLGHRSPPSPAASMASARALIASPNSAQVLRADALGTPPPCTTG